MLKINILSIAGIGLLMLLTGLLLFVFQDSIAQHRRFFLPIPPLGVAAYVFVFNLFDHYNGKLSESPWLTITEVASGTAIAGAVFFVFTLLLIVSIDQLK
jgi:hypothetical protein